MKRTSLMMLFAFAVLSCRALESDLCIAFDGVEKDMRDLREEIRQDILKLSLKVRELSATKTSSEDLIDEEFAGKLSLRDEFALRGKPRYQSVTVVNSTFPEIQTGTTFKSDSYGQHFYFNGYFLTLRKKFLSSYIDEFGNHKYVKGFQWELRNSPDLPQGLGWERDRRAQALYDAMTKGSSLLPLTKDYSFLSNEFGKEILYPLKLTNQLHSVEFSAPQPLIEKIQPLTSGDTNGSNRAVGSTQR